MLQQEKPQKIISLDSTLISLAKIIIFYSEVLQTKILIKNNIRVQSLKLQMSSQAENLPALSLLKVSSNTSKCCVFTEINQVLQRFQLSIDDSTTVSSIIDEVKQLIKNAEKTQKRELELANCELYASKKNGSKISDLPSLSGEEKIIKTGIKRFYLDLGCSTQKKKITNGSLSTKSISSQIVIQKRIVKEKKATKQFGCFCFA